jgi:uncharacterized RDD family membrane protein YckC
MRPAGFWQRGVAWTLDAAVLGPASLALAWPRLRAAGATWEDALGRLGERVGEVALAGTPPQELPALLMRDPVLAEAVAALHGATGSALVPVVAAFAALGALWNVLGERSRWQGSPGKRLLGLRVTDRAGHPPRIVRSLSRHLAGAASWLTLNLGHALAALPPEHLALHDRIAGTRVLAGASATLPRWALPWLLAVAAAAIAATAWLAVAASRAMQAGVDRAFY